MPAWNRWPSAYTGSYVLSAQINPSGITQLPSVCVRFQPAVLIYDPSWTSSSRSTMLLTAPVRMADCSPKP